MSGVVALTTFDKCVAYNLGELGWERLDSIECVTITVGEMQSKPRGCVGRGHTRNIQQVRRR